RDRDTGKLRAIDLIAMRRFSVDSEGAIPNLALVVECKRSDLPYVFFRTATSVSPPAFPAVYGLSSDRIALKSGELAQRVFGCDFVGLDDLPFITPGPPIASTFARVERKGKDKSEEVDRKGNDKVNLSGSDPFNGIVMPLVGAMEQAAAFFGGYASAES